MDLDWTKAKNQVSNLQQLLNKIKKKKEKVSKCRDIMQIENDLFQLEQNIQNLEDQISFCFNEVYKDIQMQAEQMQINIDS